MTNTRLIALSATLILSIGCSNQRNNRLSATNACDSSVRAVDQSAFGPTALEIKNEVFTQMSFEEFPDNEELDVTSIVTTVELALGNEEKAVIRVDALPATNPEPSIQCVKNIDPNSSGETIVSIPINNKNGQILTKSYKISIGNPEREDRSDFLRLEEVSEEVSEADDSKELPAEPISFTSYFSDEGSDIQFFTLTPPKDKKLTEVEKHNQDFFIHFKNEQQRVRSRLVVRRSNQKKKK